MTSLWSSLERISEALLPHLRRPLSLAPLSRFQARRRELLSLLWWMNMDILGIEGLVILLSRTDLSETYTTFNSLKFLS